MTATQYLRGEKKLRIDLNSDDRKRGPIKFSTYSQKRPDLICLMCDLKNWRPEYSKIARETGVPITTVYDCYKKYEKEIRKSLSEKRSTACDE